MPSIGPRSIPCFPIFGKIDVTFQKQATAPTVYVRAVGFFANRKSAESVLQRRTCAESWRATWTDLDRLAGSRIATRARRTLLHCKRAEPGNRHLLSPPQSIGNNPIGSEQGIDHLPSGGLIQARLLRDRIRQFRLVHTHSPKKCLWTKWRTNDNRSAEIPLAIVFLPNSERSRQCCSNALCPEGMASNTYFRKYSSAPVTHDLHRCQVYGPEKIFR